MTTYLPEGKRADPNFRPYLARLNKNDNYSFIYYSKDNYSNSYIINGSQSDHKAYLIGENSYAELNSYEPSKPIPVDPDDKDKDKDKDKNEDENGSNGSALIGIGAAVGVLVVCITLITFVLFYLRRRKDRNQTMNQSLIDNSENPIQLKETHINPYSAETNPQEYNQEKYDLKAKFENPYE